jgi:hypothetical protein
LFALGREEVLFGFSQSVGKIDQGTTETASGALGPAGAGDFGETPFRRRTLLADEIVAANEQRVGEQELGTGRGVIAINETDE